MLAYAEPVGGGVGCQPTGLSRPATRGLAGEQVLTALLGPINQVAKVALQAVDNGGKALGIYKVKVSCTAKLANRSLELVERI